MRNPEQHDFFTLLRELYLSGIQFAVEHPRYAEISKKLQASKGTPLYEQVVGERVPVAHELLEALLEYAIARGQVRADMDAKMLAYMISSMNALECCLEHLAPECDKRIMETIEKFLDFLRHGIGEKYSAGPSR